jgi:hypothetical protein
MKLRLSRRIREDSYRRIAPLAGSRALLPPEARIPGALRDADGDGRLTRVDLDAFGASGETFRSPAEMAASLVDTGARKFVFGENHHSPHPELVVATILEVARRTGQAPVVFHESYGGPFQDLVDDLQGGTLSDRDFARKYTALADNLSGGEVTEYTRKIFVPQLLAFHQAGARIVSLDDLDVADNRDAAWEARYAADQASNPHAISIFVVGGVHSQKIPSINDPNFPQNDFRRPLGERIADRYGSGDTLNIYIATTPHDPMTIYKPSFSSWDAILPMPRAARGSDTMQMVLPADEDGVPLLSPEALGGQWHVPATPGQSLPKSAAPVDRGGLKSLNSVFYQNF